MLRNDPVDHGTAFDIAGSGKASWVSMAERVRLGAEYARLFKEHGGAHRTNRTAPAAS